MEKTRLSTKGQIILPKSIRTAHAWGPGTEFTVEETKDGILLRPASLFARTRLEDVVGCQRSSRKGPTPIDTSLAIEREVARRHGRGRY